MFMIMWEALFNSRVFRWEVEDPDLKEELDIAG